MAERVRPDNLPARLGRRVRAAREARGMTHQELANAAGLSLDATQKIQAGRRDPSASTVAALARALRVSADELLGLR